MPSKRPHIIIFNPDEMRYDAMSHMGNPAAVTPNLDAFCQNDAVSFSRAFCQNPVCVPSRCSFMTGLYPHVHGHRTMSYLLHPGEDTLLKELKDNGYYVWMNDRNDVIAGQIDGWCDKHADEIFYSKGLRTPGPINNAKHEKGDKNFYSHFKGELGLDANGLNYTGDDQAVDAAIERLTHPVDDRPMCIFLGLLYPHVPYNVEKPYFNAIDRKKLPERVKLEDCKDKARILTAIHNYEAMDGYTKEDWDELRATYLGMCMKVDHQFGKLVKALKDAGIYDDCAIFFFSDHGDFTGDYSLVEKSQNTFEDCLTRVPFLIKPPKDYKVDPGISSSMVELVDFYKTAMDMAGVKPNHTQFGIDLKDVLADRSVKVRDFVCSEGGREAGEIHCDEYHNGRADENNEYYPKQLAQKDDDNHDKGIMIRNEHYKYVSRSKTMDEFYDLGKDPKEMINEINNPVYKEEILKMQHQLLKWLQHTDDVVPFEYDARFTKEMLYAKVSSLIPKGKEEEVKEFLKTHNDIVAAFMFVIGLQRQANGGK